MKEKLCGIYCIENTVNGKKYIGLSRDIYRRWSEHISKLKKHNHDNAYLQYSWNKYGKSKFIFYVLELCEEEELSDKERYYINIYGAFSHESGYNLTLGGEHVTTGKRIIRLKDGFIFDYVYQAAESVNVSNVTMIAWCRNKHNYMYLEDYETLSPEEQEYWKNFDWEAFDHEKLSKAHSRENRSEETLERNRQATRGHKNPRALKVYCPQLDETFDCIKYASDKYGINNGSITSYLKGRLKSAGVHPTTGEKLTWELVKE